MKIHIGEVIKKFAKGVKIDNMDKFCMERLNMTKQNYYKILKGESINTDVLLKFCSAFNHDFFQYYYDVEPLKTIGKSETKRMREENQDLRLAVERKEDLIKDYERKIALLKGQSQDGRQKTKMAPAKSRSSQRKSK